MPNRGRPTIVSGNMGGYTGLCKVIQKSKVPMYFNIIIIYYYCIIIIFIVLLLLQYVHIQVS